MGEFGIFIRNAFLFSVIVLFPWGYALGQVNEVEILNSDFFEGDESLGKNTSRLRGNVQFGHKGALMFCDSAYFFQETNSLDAFGNIRVVKGDSLQMTGDFLRYNGNTGIAKVKGNVMLTDRKMKLNSPEIEYNLNSEVAWFENGGELIDEKNRLTSFKGNLYSKINKVVFKDSVKLINPDYLIDADSLTYLTSVKTAVFSGRTVISSASTDSTVILTENGSYNTETQKSVFFKPTKIISKEKKLEGDRIDFDNKMRNGFASGNVVLTDTASLVTIYGDYCQSENGGSRSFITGRAELVRKFSNDTLFLHADTLFSERKDTEDIVVWKAFYGVKFFKSDIQGVCDSLVYQTPDSVMTMFSSPVLWNLSNQITAQKIEMQLSSSGVSEMRLQQDAFICSLEDTANFRYNQISGREMTSYFSDNALDVVHVLGNGESVYYTKNSKEQFTGVNRAESSDMRIQVKDGKITSICLLQDPDATLYPINEMRSSELKLKGFKWLIELRPGCREDIFKRNNGIN